MLALTCFRSRACSLLQLARLEAVNRRGSSTDHPAPPGRGGSSPNSFVQSSPQNDHVDEIPGVPPPPIPFSEGVGWWNPKPVLLRPFFEKSFWLLSVDPSRNRTTPLLVQCPFVSFLEGGCFFNVNKTTCEPRHLTVKSGQSSIAARTLKLQRPTAYAHLIHSQRTGEPAGEETTEAKPAWDQGPPRNAPFSCSIESPSL